MKLLSKVALWLARRVPCGYWRITQFAAKRDPALWNLALPLRFIPGKFLMGDLRESIFVQILRGGCFPHQAGEDQLFMKLLRPGDVVYDVGANIGYTPLLFALSVSPNGFVKAFEPSPRAFHFLSQAVAGDSTIQAINVALSDAEGTLPFYETEALDTSSLEPIAGLAAIQVPIQLLDNMAAHGPEPTFIKIDVEGHEPAVIRGMAATLARECPPTIVFEALTPEALAAILDTLRPLIRVTFQIFRISRSGELLRPSDPTGVNNYLAIPGCQAWRLMGISLPEAEVIMPYPSSGM